MSKRSTKGEAPPHEEPLTATELTAFEERLRELLDALQHEVEASENAALLPSGADRYQWDDEPVEEIALGVELGTLDAEDELGYAARAALDRIREGVYGTCAECGDRIPRERLHIVPFARMCRACAARSD